MKILVIGDNHNDIENMLAFLDKLREYNFEVIIYSGDFTDINPPKGFTQYDIAKLILEEIKTLNKQIVAIPGNNDNRSIIDLIEKEKISIHGKGMLIRDIGFYGYGGAKTPFNTNIEPTEDEVKNGLERGWNDVKNAKFKIQVTHNPPLNTRLDILSVGSHVGSKVVREFIEIKKPLAAVSAHIHEARGTDRHGNTLLINAGRFSEGYFGVIDIRNGMAEGEVYNLTE